MEKRALSWRLGYIREPGKAALYYDFGEGEVHSGDLCPRQMEPQTNVCLAEVTLPIAKDFAGRLRLRLAVEACAVAESTYQYPSRRKNEPNLAGYLNVDEKIRRGIMKRSEINAAIRELEAMCEKHCCYLPPFCHFTPEQWQEKGAEYDEVRDCMLGWDITDYGMGDFNKMGFSLITIRNGNRAMADKYPKVYAEKLLYLKEGQYAPNHFHWFKTEDIINRGGGNCLIRVYNSLPNEEIDYESDVTVYMDGRTFTVPAGTQVRLTPGESIHVQQYLYHDFSVEPGTGAVLLGEVSQCNDDNTDNRFNPPVGRFPAVEEDEAPYRLLCNEYPPAK